MKNKTIIDMSNLLKSNVLLGVSALGMLMSCGTYMNGYSETDGAYYDPNRDTVPQYDVRTAGNQIGGYYSYGDEEDDSTYYDNSIVRQSQYNQQKQKQKYQDWEIRKVILIGVTTPEHRLITPITATTVDGVTHTTVGAVGDLRICMADLAGAGALLMAGVIRAGAGV